METKLAARFMYSSIAGTPRSPERYFALLQGTENGDATILFAVINGALQSVGQMSGKLHQGLEHEFLDAELRVVLGEHRRRLDGPLIVFSRALSLSSTKILLGMQQHHMPVGPLTTIGELAIHGNDFLDSQDTLWEGDPGLVEIVCEFAPLWDLSNPRNVHKLFVRTYLLLTKYLPASAGITKLFERVFGHGIAEMAFDGLALDDYLALVFGIYTASRTAIDKQKTCLIDLDQIFRITTLPPDGIRSFLARRSGDKDTFYREFALGIDAVEAFADYITSCKRALDMNVLKQRPLFVCANGRYAVLDPQFLIELLSTTVYWTIFDALPPGDVRREFSGLWGTCFEALVIEEMQHFYPPADGILRSNVLFATGEIDILLDFGDFIIVIEVKSGLMARDPRIARDPEAFRAELHKKFVDDAGVNQLVKAVKAIAAGDIHAKAAGSRVYPILIGDEPALQTLAANRYLDEEFTKQLSPRPDTVAPLTVMSIDELDELLPYITAGDATWRQVLDVRFEQDGVTADPFHTTWATLRRDLGIAQRPHSFLSEADEMVRKRIFERYHFGETPAAQG